MPAYYMRKFESFEREVLIHSKEEEEMGERERKLVQRYFIHGRERYYIDISEICVYVPKYKFLRYI